MPIVKIPTDQITDINQLVDELNNATKSTLNKVLSRLDISADEFNCFSSWSPEGYTRNCLLRTEKYELILLCWDRDAVTPIHGHDGQNCWVYQIQGDIREVRYKKVDGELKEAHSMVLTPGKLTYMHDRMGYHQLRNISDNRAMTLHIYASPIDSCEIYDDSKSCFETKTLKYHHSNLIENQPNQN